MNPFDTVGLRVAKLELSTRIEESCREMFTLLESAQRLTEPGEVLARAIAAYAGTMLELNWRKHEDVKRVD